MKLEDNKIVIKKTIELMQKYNISKEYQKESTVKELIRIMDKAVDKVMKNKNKEQKWKQWVKKKEEKLLNTIENYTLIQMIRV